MRDTVDRVKLASCYASCLDDELSCLFLFIWNLTYYLTVLLELETTDRMATHTNTGGNRRVKLLKRTMKSETRTTLMLFLPLT